MVQQPGEAGQHAWRPEARGRVEGQRPFSDVIEQEHYVSPQQVSIFIILNCLNLKNFLKCRIFYVKQLYP